MAIKIETILKYVLVIQNKISQGLYIYETEGSWGPSHLGTDSIAEALKVDLNYIQSYVKEMKNVGWDVKPVPVEITFTIK
jgi:hypothetical protein